MPKPRLLTFWLLAGLISVAAIFCAVCVAHQRSAQLSYEGKPLEYWFNQLPMTFKNGPGFNEKVIQSSIRLSRNPSSGAVRKYGCWAEKPEDSSEAIRGIGTNAVAFYLRKLTRHHNPIERIISKVSAGGGYRFLFEDIDPERQQAVTALILLKPLPTDVVSELVTLSTNGDGEIAAAAHCALRTQENELVLLHPSASKHSLDADLVKLPMLPDLK